jgi:hypothetical protein
MKLKRFVVFINSSQLDGKYPPRPLVRLFPELVSGNFCPLAGGDPCRLFSWNLASSSVQNVSSKVVINSAAVTRGYYIISFKVSKRGSSRTRHRRDLLATEHFNF